MADADHAEDVDLADDALLGPGDGGELDDDDVEPRGTKFMVLFRDSARGRAAPTHWRGEEVVMVSPTLPLLRNTASSSALLLHDSNMDDLREC